MQWLYSLLFSLLVFICAGKRPDNCPLPKCPEKCSSQPTNCKGGLAYDYRYCECCPVCAKTEGETCGGAFSEKGSCDRGLTCTNLNSLGVGTCQNMSCPKPPIRLICPLLPNTCEHDSDCPEPTHCCYDGCRRWCRAADTGGIFFGKPKPGVCPALPKPELCASDVDECHYDWDCTGDKKCCSNGCYKQCVLPSASAEDLAKCDPPKKRDVCPLNVRSLCNDDQVCKTNYPNTSCCFDGCGRLCLKRDGTRPSAEGIKSGKCPNLKYYRPCVSDNDHCRVDGDCFGVKKCCSNTCFKVCADPVPESGAIAGPILLPSQCPNITNSPSCHVGLVHTCNGDGDCTSGTSCCFDGCRRRCMDPKDNSSGAGIAKEGECPANLPSPEYCVADADECFMDYDCIQDKKCCSNGCNKICVSPSLSIGAAYKCPLVTEPYQCHRGFEHFCNDDKDCQIGGQFCCFDGCRRKCQDPREGSSDGVTVFCMKDRMRIDIERSKINGIKAIDLRLNDPLCKAKHNNTHYSLETPLVGCGTESKHAKDYIVYSNEVQEPRQTENLISRIPDLTVPFACLYSKEGVTSSYGLKPKNKVTGYLDGGNIKTKFTLELSLFHDEAYLNPFNNQEYPIQITIDEPLYVQASVDSIDKWLTVKVDSCHATPTQDKDDPTKYYLIRDGCQVDSTVRKHRAPDPTKERFSFKAFEFSDQSKSFVYLHCHMTVCNISNPDSRCSIGCLQLPRKRRAAEEPGAQLRQGPLFFVGSETHSAKRAAQGASSNYITWVVVAMAVFCALCFAAVLYMKFKKSTPRPDPDRETYI